MQIPIDAIQVRDGRRELDASHVRELAGSIRELGLLNPVTIDQDNVLIAGLHRLEAARILGWTEIECTVSRLEGLQAELAEIDENIVRSDLSVLEYGEMLLRRKEIYEQIHPEVKHGGDRKSKEIKAKKIRLDSAKSFVQDTAQKLNVVPRTVELQIQTAKNLTPEAKEIIRESNTKITKKAALHLSRLEPEQQKEIAARLAAGEIHSIDKDKTNKQVKSAKTDRGTNGQQKESPEKSVKSAEALAEPAKEPIEPVKKTTEPAKESAESAKKTAEPAKKPVEPVKEFVESVKEPTGPVKEPVESVKEPTGSAKKSMAKPTEELKSSDPVTIMEKPSTQNSADTNKAELPYKLESKPFSTLKESIADLKNPNKDCSSTPDSFLAELDAFVRKFQREIEWYSNPYYQMVYPLLTEQQRIYLRQQIDRICQAAEDLYRLIEERNKTP